MHPIHDRILCIEGEKYCQECYNKKMDIIRQTDNEAKKVIPQNQKLTETFICSKCKRELAIKYLHTVDVCADCFVPPESSKCFEGASRLGRPDRFGDTCKIVLPKTLFQYSDQSYDAPGDSVYRCWEDVVLCKDGKLILERNSITYSAHSIGHNTGRDTTSKPISFDQLQKMIMLSSDKRAEKYVGMNEQNWQEYVKEKKTDS